MPDENKTADELIPGSLKRSRSYHSTLGTRTYGETKTLAYGPAPNSRARQMKKPIEQADRLRAKLREKRR